VGRKPRAVLYQRAGVGKQCASGIWLPWSARVVPVCGVMFCWYGSIELSPLDQSAMRSRWDLLLLWSRSYICSIHPWCKL